MKDKYSKGELAKDILKGIALGGFIAVCFVAPNFAQVAKLFETQDAKDKRRLKRSLNNLEKQKLVKISYDKNGNEIIKITEKGKKRVLKYNFIDLKISIPKKWDKLWRLVIFDIPEVHKRARDAVTFKLQDMGFHALQKSAYIAPYECRDEIDFICESLKVRRFVNYFLVKEIDNEDFLKKKFSL